MSSTGPASIGTLRELAAFMLEVLRRLAGTPAATDATAPTTRSPRRPSYDAQRTRQVTFQAVEQTFLYAYTQLAATVHQPAAPALIMDRTDGLGMDVDREREGLFSQNAVPGAIEQVRSMRQWKDLAVDLNLLAKDVPYKTGAGADARLFFDEIQKSTYNLVQTLDRRIKAS